MVNSAVPRLNMRDVTGAPAGTAAPAVVTPVDGLNHSTFNVRDDGIADTLTVNDPPVGA